MITLDLNRQLVRTTGMMTTTASMARNPALRFVNLKFKAEDGTKSKAATVAESKAVISRQCTSLMLTITNRNPV